MCVPCGVLQYVMLKCISVCHSVLQYCAICCSALRCGSICDASQCGAVLCSVMQCVAVLQCKISVLQCIAACRSVLHVFAACCSVHFGCCSELYCVADRYVSSELGYCCAVPRLSQRVLQCIAVFWNVVQYLCCGAKTLPCQEIRPVTHITESQHQNIFYRTYVT